MDTSSPCRSNEVLGVCRAVIHIQDLAIRVRNCFHVCKLTSCGLRIRLRSWCGFLRFRLALDVAGGVPFAHLRGVALVRIVHEGIGLFHLRHRLAGKYLFYQLLRNVRREVLGKMQFFALHARSFMGESPGVGVDFF